MYRGKILYIMGVDWNWIFQRPQIIEQHLEEKYDMTVVYPRSILKRSDSDEKCEARPNEQRILWTIPKQEKIGFIGKIGRILSGHIFKDIDEFDAVILGYPLYYRYIPSSYRGVVIYDCMDCYEALYPDKRTVYKLIQEERRLIENGAAIVVTAQRLYQKVAKFVPKEKIELIRNGTFITQVYQPQTRVERKNIYKIGYFGTISDWFDYQLLINSCQRHSDVNYHLIGPVVKACPVESDRIVMEGVVPNAELASYTRDYDCLIMPFIVNDVVEWVDPVKLYEYIVLGKCIISVRYEEIERFEPYVYMYSDEEEYEKLLAELIEKDFPAKYTREQQLKFLNENSWEQRFAQWDELLCRCIGENNKTIEGEVKNEN